MIWDILLDAAIDTLRLFPFLFVTYFAMETLEGRAGDATEKAIRKAGSFGPLIGALVGIVPQCGFSAVGATLWSGRVVTVGTMLAVFLSTGDELLPVFLAEGAPWDQLVWIIAVKAVFAMLAGFAVDLALKVMHAPVSHRSEVCGLCEREGCGCGHKHVHPHAAEGDADAHGHDHDGHVRDHAGDGHDHAGDGHDHGHTHDHAHGHDHGETASWGAIAGAALYHSLRIAVFIFLVSLLIGGAVELTGEDVLAAFMNGNPVLSVLACALVGLIPNCAASVVLAELYLQSTIALPALIAGSLANAGVGLIVLWRTNRPHVYNALATASLWGFAVIAGLIVLASGFAF